MDLLNAPSYILNQNKAILDGLSKFIAANNIVATCAAVVIGVGTKDLIQSLVSDIIIPSIVNLLKALDIRSLQKQLPQDSQLHITHYIMQFVTWIFILIVTFVFIKFMFNTFLGISNEGPSQETARQNDKSGSNQ